jgi:hypothetical protein
MNTARIVVLTIAVGAGGVAAYPAGGSDNKPFPTEPVAQLRNMDAPGRSEMLAHARQTGPLLPALGSKPPKEGRTV